MTGRPLMAGMLVAVSAAFWWLERSTYIGGFGGHYVLVALLVAWYLRLLLRDNRAATLTSFYQIFYGIGMLASAAVISSGAEMIEIGAVGTANGFFWLMLGFFVIGIEATVLGYRYGHALQLPAPALRLSAGVNRTIMLSLLLPTLVLSLYVFVLTGGPVLRGVDRVTFWRSIAPMGTTILPTLLTQTFFFVAFLYLWRARIYGTMLMVRLLLIAYLLSATLVLGQKFSLFILFLNMWLVVTIGVVPEFRVRLRHLVAIAVVAALLLLNVAISYFIDGRDAGFILVRIALQAQLLWSIAESSLHGVAPLLRPECYFGCDWHVSGADYISRMYLPAGLYDFYKDGGTSLSGFMPALPILTLGPAVAVVLHIFIGFISGILQRKITISLVKNQPIYGFLLFKLHFSVTIIWFAAMQTAIPGLLPVLAAILVYRMTGVLPTGRSTSYTRA